MRLTDSAPERATHVSLYAPGRRTVAGSRSRTTFAPAFTRSRQVCRRRFFASRSVAVTWAGLETMIRTAIVVVFFSAIRFALTTENASRVCGAAGPSETTRSTGPAASANRVVAGSTTTPAGAAATASVTWPIVKPAAPSAAVASASVLPASTGTALSEAVRGLTLPAASFCTSVKLRVSPAENAPSFASYSVGPNSRYGSSLT